MRVERQRSYETYTLESPGAGWITGTWFMHYGLQLVVEEYRGAVDYLYYNIFIYSSIKCRVICTTTTICIHDTYIIYYIYDRFYSYISRT